MHAAATVDCNTGYEWWLMEQAKALNPSIKLYGLAWGAPGWIGGGNFWSTDMINYPISWLGCAKSHGLTIASNPTFASAVSIIGVHYPCQGGDGGNADTCPGNATATSTGKPLWASENGSQDLNSGAPALTASRSRAADGPRRHPAQLRAGRYQRVLPAGQ